ncbi:MAG: hypothetical protein V4607_12140 [Pseudomonadota bacterium]
MNTRIACLTLVLLSLAACGQAGKLTLPDKDVPTPKAAEAKATVVDPISNETPDATPTTPAQTAPAAPKKEKP